MASLAVLDGAGRAPRVAGEGSREARLESDTRKPPAGALLEHPLIAVAALLVLGIVLPAVVSGLLGSFGLPWNDDWSYRSTAIEFVRTGHLRFGGWTSMTLVGQILWAWPFLRVFGVHPWVFAVSTMALASLGVACAYYVARRLVTPKLALGATGFLLLIPGLAMNTSTFMTDIPALSAVCCCLALGIGAVRHTGWRFWLLLAASMSLGIFAFSIREFTLPAPVAVVFVVIAYRSRQRYRCIATGVLLVGICGSIYEWSQHTPGLLRIPLGLPSVDSFTRLVQAYFTTALLVAPAITFRLASRHRLFPRVGQLIGGGVLLLGAVWFHLTGVLVGNYIDPSGMVTAVLNGHQPPLFGQFGWRLISLIAVLSGALLAAELASWAHERGGMREHDGSDAAQQIVFVFTVFMAAELTAYCLLTQSFYDRYLWPIALGVNLHLLRRAAYQRPAEGREGLRRWTTLTVSVVLLGITGVLAVNSDAFLLARSKAGRVAVALGLPAPAVDGGIEWIASHNPAPLSPTRPASPPTFEPIYARMHPGFRDCGVVSASELPARGLRLLTTVPYPLYGLFGRGHLYVYAVHKAGC